MISGVAFRHVINAETSVYAYVREVLSSENEVHLFDAVADLGTDEFMVLYRQEAVVFMREVHRKPEVFLYDCGVYVKIVAPVCIETYV